PRRYRCGGQGPAPLRFRPQATLLPERTPPAWLDLATQWAARRSYGLPVQLLQDGRPSAEPLAAVTIRHHVRTVAPRLAAALGEAPGSFLAQGPAKVAAFPMPAGPLLGGMAGGDGKAQGAPGACEGLAGQSLRALHRGAEAQAPVSSQWLACVPT